MFGARLPTPNLNPLYVIVVQPSDEADFAASSPNALILVLPASGRGEGYGKNVVKLLAQGSTALHLTGEYKIRIPFVWLCSDKISALWVCPFLRVRRATVDS